MRNLFPDIEDSFLLIFLLFVFFIPSCKIDDNITSHSPPNLSSDILREGKFIVFSSDKDGTYDIFLAQVDSAGFLLIKNYIYPENPFNLTGNRQEGNEMQPAFSSDGRILVYSSWNGNSKEIYALFFNEHYLIDTTITLNPIRLIVSNGYWDENPCFSPDMRYIVFDRRTDTDTNGIINEFDNRDLYIANIYRSDKIIFADSIRPLTNTPDVDESNPEWSPRVSIRKVAYNLSSNPNSFNRDIYIIDPLLPRNNLPYQDSLSAENPCWGPACNELIFELRDTYNVFYRIVKAGYPANTGFIELILLFGTNVQEPARKPNDNFIVYTIVNNGNNKGKIFVYSFTGNSHNLLPDIFQAYDNRFPAW
ncbi:MAG: TolB family protein [Ignavibacteria bacterium]